MNSTRQIKLGAIISYSAIVLNIVAGLIYTPWMIRQIGRADYGLYALIGSFLTYFVMDFGLGDAIARFISKYRAENHEGSINDLLGLTAKLYLLIDMCLLVVLVILFFFIENIFVQLKPIEIEKLRVIFCIAGLFSIVSLPFIPMNSVLIAYERFVVLKVCDICSKIFTIGLIVAALLAGYKLYALVAVNALVGIIIIGIKYLYISRSVHIKINFSFFDSDLLKQLVGMSLWIALIGIAMRFFFNIMPTILGIYSGTAEIAIFSIGNVIEGYNYSFSNAVGGLFLPRVTKLMVTDNRHEVVSLMIRVGRIQLFVLGMFAIEFITLGKQFITLWVGQDFQKSYLVTLFLILPELVTLTQSIALTMVVVVNKLKYQAFTFIGASVFSVGLSSVLAPRFGAIGSAIAIGTALMLFHVIGMNFIYYKILGLDIGRFFRECHLKMIIPFLLSLGAGYLVNFYIPAHNLISFLPKASLLMVAYFILMWALGLNKEEKIMIKSIAQKIPFIGTYLIYNY